VKGESNQQDYGMRIYDTRLGKFLSVDPLTTGYPWYTPYQFAGNKPIWAVDLDGLEEYYSNTDGKYLGHGKDEKNNEARLATKFEPLKDAKGNIVPDRYVIFQYKKITFKDAGEDLKKLYTDAQKAGGENGKERGGFLVLDLNTATVYFRRHKEHESKNDETTTNDDQLFKFKGAEYVVGESGLVVLAQIHTHQYEYKYLGETVQEGKKGKSFTFSTSYSFKQQYSTPQGDGNVVKNHSYNIFSIGINVSFYSNKGLSKSINGLTTREKLFSNTYKILQYALEKYSKQ
jgi:RHS repeat-associated protein